jgi:hypothetical protein
MYLPELSSPHLNAGCHCSSKQISLQLIPVHGMSPGFDSI